MSRIDEELCLGCGVCNVACKNKALSIAYSGDSGRLFRWNPAT
jgi:ferredoxin